MSVRMTEALIRRGLRFCSRSSLWQQRSFLFPTKDASFPSPKLAHIWRERLNQTRLVGSGKSYTVDSHHSGDLGEMAPPSSPKEDLLPSEIQPGSASDQKPLNSAFRMTLRSCACPLDVLDLTCDRHLTANEVSWSLSQMWTAVKAMTEEQRRHALRLTFERPALEGLLRQAMAVVGQMSGQDIAYSLLSMLRLGVPHHSRVCQTFLRACQEKLNDFDEKCLDMVASNLALLEDSPNVAGLKKGIRLVVQERFPTFNNKFVVHNLKHLLETDCPPDLRRKLEKKLLADAGQLNLRDVYHIMFVMSSMNFHSKPLLLFCIKMIKENMHEVPFGYLKLVLSLCKDLQHRDFGFFTAVSDLVASKMHMSSNEQLLLFLSRFMSLRFCPTALVEVFVQVVITKPDILTCKEALWILDVFSFLNYDLKQRRQPFLDSLTRILDSHLPNMTPFKLLKAVHHLCLLGHFPTAPLQQLLRSSAVEQLRTAELSDINQRNLQIVDLCLRLDRPPLPATLSVPTFLLRDPRPRTASEKPWLAHALQALVTDQEGATLQESVVVENYYVIDYVITKPRPIQPSGPEGNNDSGEERSPAKCSQRIAVIWAPNSFCYGTLNPCGPLALMIRHLEILDFDQVLALRSMSDLDRLHFIRRETFPEHHGSDAQSEEEKLES